MIGARRIGPARLFWACGAPAVRRSTVTYGTVAADGSGAGVRTIPSQVSTCAGSDRHRSEQRSQSPSGGGARCRARPAGRGHRRADHVGRRAAGELFEGDALQVVRRSSRGCSRPPSAGKPPRCGRGATTRPGSTPRRCGRAWRRSRPTGSTVISSRTSIALNRVAVGHAQSGRSNLGEIVLANGRFAIGERLKPLLEAAREARLHRIRGHGDGVPHLLRSGWARCADQAAARRQAAAEPSRGRARCTARDATVSDALRGGKSAGQCRQDEEQPQEGNVTCASITIVMPTST